MGKDSYAVEIIKIGYIDCVHSLITKAINLLDYESKLPAN